MHAAVTTKMILTGIQSFHIVHIAVSVWYNAHAWHISYQYVRM